MQSEAEVASVEVAVDSMARQLSEEAEVAARQPTQAAVDRHRQGLVTAEARATIVKLSMATIVRQVLAVPHHLLGLVGLSRLLPLLQLLLARLHQACTGRAVIALQRLTHGHSALDRTGNHSLIVPGVAHLRVRFNPIINKCAATNVTSTGPRSARPSVHPSVADLPKPIDGGQKAEPLVDRAKLDRLQEEAEKLRKAIDEKEARKRKSLREWDRLSRETEAASLKTQLAEEALRRESGEGEGMGAF